MLTERQIKPYRAYLAHKRRPLQFLPSTLRRQRSEANQPVPADHIVDTTLHVAETGKAARLALEVVDNSSQRREVLAAAAVRAVVQTLLVCRRVSLHPTPALQNNTPTESTGPNLRTAEFRCWSRPLRSANRRWQR